MQAVVEKVRYLTWPMVVLNFWLWCLRLCLHSRQKWLNIWFTDQIRLFFFPVGLFTLCFQCGQITLLNWPACTKEHVSRRVQARPWRGRYLATPTRSRSGCDVRPVRHHHAEGLRPVTSYPATKIFLTVILHLSFPVMSLFRLRARCKTDSPVSGLLSHLKMAEIIIRKIPIPRSSFCSYCYEEEKKTGLRRMYEQQISDLCSLSVM